jgi:transcriptional regulator with XRE-family HTH domain
MRAYRTALGLTQEKLAERANTAVNYIALIEGGKKFPSVGMLERIAEALEREPPELFATSPVKRDWEEDILRDIRGLIDERLEKLQKKEYT